MTQLERLTIQAWKALPWAMFTTCTHCKRITYCHGRTRDKVKCLECFDQT